jgi:sulfate/thiosulfate transport system ATP-binding protein
VAIRIERLSKRFGDFLAVDDVSFEVADGELVALLGPSGGGKSTVLRIVSGLETADSGTVELGGQRVDHLHARARQVGFVFQHYALFQHMTVAENIAFGLDVQKVEKSERKRRVAELVGLVGLRGMEGRYPHQLSGGQRQRVALARALAPRPRVLLLDEPFGAVDAKVREELRRWLRRLHDELHATTLFVTHDQEEAFSVADRVLIINRGKLEQNGTPLDVLDHPATEFVARFVGEVNVYDTVVSGGRARIGPLDVSVAGHDDDTNVRLVIRPYDIKFFRVEQHGLATADRVLPLGDRVRVEATLSTGEPMVAQFPRRSSLLRGVEVGCSLGIEITHTRAYPRTSTK